MRLIIARDPRKETLYPTLTKETELTIESRP
jgi:hypothetical protein